MLNRHVLIYLVGHMAPAVIGFIALTSFTRLLSPGEYGVYTVGMSAAGIVTASCYAWIRLSVSRYQASAIEIDLRATAFAAFGGATLLVAVISPVVIFFAGPKLDLKIVATSLVAALALGAFEISQEFRRARQKPLHFATVAVLRSLFGVALSWLAIAVGWGGTGLLAAVSASFLIGSLLHLIHDRDQPVLPVQRGYLARFVRYGMPMALGGLAFALYSASDRLVVAYLLGDDAAGHFGVSADLARQFIVILAASVASATFPVIFRTLATEGPQAARDRLSENVEILLAVIAPVGVGLAVAADPLARVLVGSDFRESAALLLPFLAFARLLAAINQYYVQISFQLAEKPFLPLIQEIFVLIINVAVMLPLVWKFGLLGAAIATLITEGLGLVLSIAMTRYAFPLPFEASRIARVFVATAIMAGAAQMAKSALPPDFQQLVSAIVAGGLAYTAAAWIFDVGRVRTSVVARLRLRPAT